MRRVVYVALLRGNNFGGKAKVAMAALRDTSASVGCEHVITYLQSRAGYWGKANDVELAYVPS